MWSSGTKPDAVNVVAITIPPNYLSSGVCKHIHSSLSRLPRLLSTYSHPLFIHQYLPSFSPLPTDLHEFYYF